MRLKPFSYVPSTVISILDRMFDQNRKFYSKEYTIRLDIRYAFSKNIRKIHKMYDFITVKCHDRLQGNEADNIFLCSLDKNLDSG